MENVNWLSMVISTLIPTITGMIYYSPPVMMKPWMASIGMTQEQQKSGNMGLIIGLSVLMAFLVSFFMLNFNNQPGQEGQFDNFGHGAAHGLFLTLFLIAPIIITKSLFEQRSFKYMAITIFYWGVTLALMGGTLDAMNHWPNTI